MSTCTECLMPLTRLDLDEGATDHAGCAGVVMAATRWSEETPRLPDPLAHLDERKPCPDCGRLMGRTDAEIGQCVMCRNIAAANQAARTKETT